MLNKDGLATKDERLHVFNYDANGEFTGSSFLKVEKGTGIPAQSTLVENLKSKEGFTQVFNEESEKWGYVVDHCYKKAYDVNTKQELEINYIGDLKSEHTLIAPPTYDHEFIDGQWIITEEKQAELEALKKAKALEQKRQKYFEIEATIQRLERIRERNNAEQVELDVLIDESTELFREIRAEEAVSMNEEGASE